MGVAFHNKCSIRDSSIMLIRKAIQAQSVSILHQDIRITGDGIGLPIRKPDARAGGKDEADMKPLGNRDQVGVVHFEPRARLAVEMNHRFARQVAYSAYPTALPSLSLIWHSVLIGIVVSFQSWPVIEEHSSAVDTRCSSGGCQSCRTNLSL